MTEFERRVLLETRRIPYGETVTYSEIARRIGNPGAYRAVGNALKKNPLPIFIPCHRVVGKNGVGGYKYGIDIKKKLLEIERGRKWQGCMQEGEENRDRKDP
ncbi:MAG: methylated-DNA--[protein]-cysteine S-methyltransferase [Candidatus Syntropharchaeia archaeon]